MKLTLKRMSLMSGSVVLGLVVMALSYWVLTFYHAQDIAVAALKSDDAITVETKKHLTFTPTDVTPDEGFIFYPGGQVDAEAYAPLARDIASEGYVVVIAQMPLNFAMLGVNTADKIIEAHPEIESWSIGGHSLGGVAASRYAAMHEHIEGLALLASYPADDALKQSHLAVASIYGSEDQVINAKNLANSRDLLPSDTTFDEIAGGNHGQFGDYGAQKGDGQPTISADEQRKQTVTTIVKLLEVTP